MSSPARSTRRLQPCPSSIPNCVWKKFGATGSWSACGPMIHSQQRRLSGLQIFKEIYKLYTTRNTIPKPRQALGSPKLESNLTSSPALLTQQEMQRLVRDGYGLTLLREGTPLDSGLITRPLVGVNWTVDTAVVYHKDHHPETIPVLVRLLKQRLPPAPNKSLGPSGYWCSTNKKWNSQTAFSSKWKGIQTDVFARLSGCTDLAGHLKRLHLMGKSQPEWCPA